jgi:hypothetical protein
MRLQSKQPNKILVQSSIAPVQAARPFDGNEQIKHDAQDRAKAEDLKRGPAALDDGTRTGQAQECTARPDADGYEEGDGAKVQQPVRRQVLFTLGQRCVGQCERADAPFPSRFCLPGSGLAALCDRWRRLQLSYRLG